MKYDRCKFELIVEEFFGLTGNNNENDKIDCDYSMLVNLVAFAVQQQRKLNLKPSEQLVECKHRNVLMMNNVCKCEDCGKEWSCAWTSYDEHKAAFDKHTEGDKALFIEGFAVGAKSEWAKEYWQSQQVEKCEADHLSIDELLLDCEHKEMLLKNDKYTCIKCGKEWIPAFKIRFPELNNKWRSDAY